MNSTEKFLGRKGVAATIHFGDFRDVELSRQFDMVMSFGLIEHFDYPVLIVKDYARLCAPGGRVALTVPNFATLVNRLLMKHCDSPGYEKHCLQLWIAKLCRLPSKRSDFRMYRSVPHRSGAYILGDGGLPLGQINRLLS